MAERERRYRGEWVEAEAGIGDEAVSVAGSGGETRLAGLKSDVATLALQFK